jgi:hypothetical protein
MGHKRLIKTYLEVDDGGDDVDNDDDGDDNDGFGDAFPVPRSCYIRDRSEICGQTLGMNSKHQNKKTNSYKHGSTSAFFQSYSPANLASI